MAQDTRAFALKETLSDDFSGGTVTVAPDGRTLNVKARLDNNNGVIVTNDHNEIVALENYPALKSVPVPTKTTKKGDA